MTGAPGPTRSPRRVYVAELVLTPRRHQEFALYPSVAVADGAQRGQEITTTSFERAVRAARTVETVQLGQVAVRQFEAEDLSVLNDPVAVSRFGERDETTLHRSADQNLGRCPAQAPGNRGPTARQEFSFC